jgi:hypothetical protein
MQYDWYYTNYERALSLKSPKMVLVSFCEVWHGKTLLPVGCVGAPMGCNQLTGSGFAFQTSPYQAKIGKTRKSRSTPILEQT